MKQHVLFMMPRVNCLADHQLNFEVYIHWNAFRVARLAISSTDFAKLAKFRPPPAKFIFDFLVYPAILNSILPVLASTFWLFMTLF